MDNQTKDRINLLRFEIENLKRRKMECINDAIAIAIIQNEIDSKTTELSFLETPPDNEMCDEAIDSDNNCYRERYF